MNAYIWQSASNVTDSYHSHGGLVVVAASLDRAREIIAQPFCEGFWPHGDEHSADNAHCDMKARADCGALTTDPDITYELAGSPAENLLIFPDAGCC